MCIFTSDKDIPGHVRLTTRTLQYLIIPLLSAALLVVGILHVHDCSSQPLLPIWHIVAGSTGLVVPLLYLLFDDLNPALAKRCPALSEALDNVVVFVLPVYIIFEIAWLVTGTVWLIGVNPNPEECDKTIHVFSMVVVINFWIHILTPLLFMLCLCCTKIFPFLGHCTYWNIMKGAVDMWTRPVRITIVSVVAVPLGLSMISVGAHSLQECESLVNHTDTEAMVLEAHLAKEIHSSHTGILSLEMVHIPIWLLVAGILVLAVPAVYYIYDARLQEVQSGVGHRFPPCRPCLGSRRISLDFWGSPHREHLLRQQQWNLLVCLCLPNHSQLPDGHLDLLQDLRHPLLGSHLWR